MVNVYNKIQIRPSKIIAGSYFKIVISEDFILLFLYSLYAAIRAKYDLMARAETHYTML